MRSARFVGLLIVASLLFILTMPATLPAQVGVSITIAPPALPVYAQPICPGLGKKCATFLAGPCLTVQSGPKYRCRLDAAGRAPLQRFGLPRLDLQRLDLPRFVLPRFYRKSAS